MHSLFCWICLAPVWLSHHVSPHSCAAAFISCELFIKPKHCFACPRCYQYASVVILDKDQLILNNPLREQLIPCVDIASVLLASCQAPGHCLLSAKLITFSPTGKRKLGSSFDVLNMWMTLLFCLSLHSPNSLTQLSLL